MSDMGSDIAIRVNSLSKKYTIGSHKSDSFRDTLSRVFKKREPSPERDFWALKDVSFEIKKGEAVGVIGKNGAGKSTLLKVLSRITEPTTGKITLNGRVSSLLEVGTGFHPELTGKENIYLNGTILGMSRQEVKEKFDEIVAFSGVEKFLNTPVKHYSSGMYVRLAFAVAAHLEPEILIIDEVLAVGDAEFQKKCLGKMEDITNQGRTVIFVSHNMQAIQNLCPNSLLLEHGKLILKSSTKNTITQYLENTRNDSSQTWQSGHKQKDVYFSSVSVQTLKSKGKTSLHLYFSVLSHQDHPKLLAAFDIKNSFNLPVLQIFPSSTFIEFRRGVQNFSLTLDLPPLIPDSYYISAWLGPHNTDTLDWQKNIICFEIIESPIEGRSYPHSPNNGLLVYSPKIKAS